MQSGSYTSSQIERTADLSDARPDLPWENQPSTSNSDKNKLTDADKGYFGSWVISDARFLGNLGQAGYLYSKHQDINYQDNIEVTQEMQTSTLIGSGCGIITGIILHYAFKNRYRRASSYNPIYRTVDTLANVGSAVGETLGYLDLPFIPNGAQRIFSLIMADVIGLTVGLLAFPYWLIRENLLKIPASGGEHTYAKVGAEGWSRYGKTGTVLGRNAGQLIGFTASPKDSSFNTSRTMGFYGAMGAIGGFFTSLIMVPVINKLTNGALIASDKCTIQLLTEKQFKLRDPKENTKNAFFIFRSGRHWQIRFMNNKGMMCILDGSQIDGLSEKLYSVSTIDELTGNEKAEINKLIETYYQRYAKNLLRNNYIRSGLTFGVAVGSVLGFFIGLAVPVIGPIISLAVFGAFGGIAGGISIGAMGHSLTENIHQGKNVENTWDYTTRSTATIFAAAGTIIGLFLPIPGGALLGGFIGAAIGWGVGLTIPQYARKLNPIEEKTTTISWTFRSDLANNVGMLIGGLIGLAAGLAGGPLGMVVGISLGIAIGTLVGSAFGILYEKCARKQIWRGIKEMVGIKDTPIADPPTHQIELTQTNQIAPIEQPLQLTTTNLLRTMESAAQSQPALPESSHTQDELLRFDIAAPSSSFEQQAGELTSAWESSRVNSFTM